MCARMQVVVLPPDSMGLMICISLVVTCDDGPLIDFDRHGVCDSSQVSMRIILHRIVNQFIFNCFGTPSVVHPGIGQMCPLPSCTLN